MKTLRTRNKFSATSVDQLPAPVRGLAALRPPAAAPDPGHRPHRLLPGPRRQPDGLQRLADDRARLPAAAARPQGARRPAGRARPAAHRDGEGGHRAPLRAARLRRRRAARDAARAVRGGAHHSPGVRRPRRGGRATWSPPSPPSAPSSASGIDADDDPAAGPRLRGGRPRRGVRPDGGLDAGLRLGLPVGDQAAQPADRQPRPGGRRAVHRARVDVVERGLVGPGHHDVWRSRVRGLPEFGGELPVAVLREEIETPGDGQIRAMVTVAGNPVLSTPRRPAAGRRRSTASTSWSPSTSTSTRPPGTPT